MNHPATMLVAMLQHPWSRALGVALVQSVAQGAVIALLLAAGLALLRNSSPHSRYVLACGGLLTMLLLPVITWWSFAGEVSQASPVPFATSAIVPADRSASVSAPVASRSRRGILASPSLGATGLSRAAEPWLPVVVTLWLAGVFGLSVWRTGGLAYTWYLRHHDTVTPVPRWQARLQSLATRLGVRRRVQLLESLRLQAPVAVGWLRPVVLMPFGALSGLGVSQLEAILAHELAHIRRHDYLVNLMQTTVETLLFYHPAAWWVSARIRAEREFCCDDAAAAVCGGGRVVASALAELESWVGAVPPMVVSAGGNSLLARVQRQAARARRQGGAGMAESTGVAVCGLALVLLSALLTVPGSNRGAEAVRLSHDELLWYTLGGSSAQRSLAGPDLDIDDIWPTADRLGTPDGALQFDGGRGRVAMVDRAQGDFRTIAFWARSRVAISATSARGYTVVGSCPPLATDNHSGVSLGPTSSALDNEVVTLLWEGTHKAFYWTTATLPHGIDTGWHLWVFSWDEANRTYDLYADGVALGPPDVTIWNNCSNQAPASSPVPTCQVSRQWQMGRMGEDANDGWVGAIDMLRVYARSLTAAEVRALYLTADDAALDLQAAQGAMDALSPAVTSLLDLPPDQGADVDAQAGSRTVSDTLVLTNSAPRWAHYEVTATNLGVVLGRWQCTLASRGRQPLLLSGLSPVGGRNRVCLTSEMTRGALAPAASLEDTVTGYAGLVATLSTKAPGMKYTLVTVDRSAPESAAVRAFAGAPQELLAP